ncbi:UNVERIFIED_CONTAM: hypothetical protein PYX00_000802 [Menopon gallinae]|uniref:PDZ domain-containing protein n=1 Tax=Menopon gallinae TaxID=328185 RepID=A0AAW2IAJ5_9NEOP
MCFAQGKNAVGVEKAGVDALDDISQNTPTLDDRSMFSSCESLSQSPKKEERSEAVIEGSEDVPKHPGKRHARKSSEREEGQSDDDRLDSEELLEKQFSTDGELEKSTDEDALSSDLLQLMVPVATERTMYQRTPSTGDITDDDLDEEDFPSGWAADIIHLPPSIEVEIRVHKGTEPLGISIDSVDKGVNGMLVMLVVPGGAVARDGHIHPGDYLISVNHETLRRVTNSQARAILRRAQLLSTDISVTYIPGEAAAAYRRSIQQEPQTPPLTKVVRTSPRSPYIPSDSSVESSEERDRETGQQPSRSLKGSPVISRSPHLTPADSVTKQSSVESTKSAEEAFPASQIPSPLNEEEFPKSQIPSPLDVDDIFKDVESSAAQLKPREAAAEPEAPRPAKEAEGKRGPLSVCVVDGLYSVHSPKGNKVLVGVELSPKDAKDRKPVPSGSPKKKREEKIKTLPAVREHVKVLKKTNLSFDVQDTQKEREDVKAVRSFTVEETVPEADSPSKISARTNVNVVSVTKKSDKSEKAQTKQTDRTRQGDGDKAQAGPPQQTEVRRPKERTVPRVPSFECTCEETVEKTSPECTCFSSPEVTEVPTSSQSKKSEVKKVLSPPSESSSYHTNQEVTVNQELLNTESIFSSEEEFKSGATSPFYSPRGDSPEMTIVKQANKMDKEVTANILLAKHWGPERTVEVVREPNCSLGISIVGGKVDLYNAGPDSNSAILGIFIKNVLPNSPAGRLGELKTGDRILEVDSIDLRSASHERAVEVIRSAGNKVRFLVQSLIQWSVEGEPETASLPSVVAKETTRVEESLPTEPESAAAEVESEVAQKSSDEPKAEQEEAEKQVAPPPVKEPEREAPAKKAEEPEEKKVEPKKESSKESDEEEEEDDDYEYRDLEGKMYTAKGEEIYRASAGNVKRTKEEIAADPEEEDQFGYTTSKFIILT